MMGIIINNKEKIMLQLIKMSFLLVALWSLNACSESAAPLGITIGKSTLKDVESKYKIIEKDCNIDEYGCYYYMNHNELPLKNITLAAVNLDKKEIVRYLELHTAKENFESFFESISKKYKLKHKEIPSVGNKEALFEADNCIIKLYAPHMSFEMKITYFTKDFLKLVEDNIEQKQKSKKQSQDDAL